MSFKKYTILYVDDSKTNLFLFSDVFSLFYEVITAESGKEGLKILRSTQIDLIVSDYRMPLMSGVDFLIKATEINYKAPRILLTAYGDFNSIKDAINKAKIHHFATKPWDAKELKIIIDNALRTYELTRENEILNEKLLKQTKILEEQLIQKEELLQTVKISEENHFKSQNYFRNIINTAGSVLIVLAKDFAIIEWNNEAEKYFGYSKEEVVFKNFIDFFGDSIDLSQCKQNIELIFEDGEKRGYENCIIDKNNVGYSMLWNLSLLTDGDEVIGVINVGNNIEDIKKAEEESRRNERLYRMLAENTNDVIWTMNAAGEYLFVSSAVERLQGYSPEELTGEKLIDRIVPESQELLSSYIHDFLEKINLGVKDQVSDTIQLQQYCKDGRTVHTEVVLNKIYDNEDKFIFFLGVSRDITFRLQAEAELKFSEEKFSKIFQSNPDAIMLTSLETGVFVDANEIAYSITGYLPEEIVGKTDSELAIWKNAEDRDSFYAEMADHGRIVNLEADFRIKSGEIRTGLISGELIEFKEGIFILSIIRDITQIKIEQENLRISEDKFFTIFNVTPDLILLTKLNTGEIIDANDQLALAIGKAKEELIGKTTIEIGFWIEKNFRDSYAKALLKDGTVSNYEAEYHSVSNTVQVGLISGKIISLQGEKCIISIIRNITQRKEGEERLKQSEERFRTIFENSVVGYYRMSVQGEIIMANPTLIKMLEYRGFKELTQASTSNNIFGDPEVRKQLLDEISEKGEIVDVESVWRTKSNETVYVSESAKAQKNDQGFTDYFDGTVVDISARKLMEESLNKSQALFKGITEQSSEGLTLVDLEGKYVLANNAFTNMVGYTEKELLNMRINDLVESHTESSLFPKIINTGKGSAEAQLIHKDGSKVFVEIRGNLINIGDTKLVVGVTTDISARVESEKALRRSEARLREAQKIAHIGHWIYNHSDNNLEWSDEVYRIYGLNKRHYKPTAETALLLTHEEDRDELIQVFNNSLKELGKYSNTRKIVREDGAVRYITEVGRTTFDASGAPKKTIGTVQDVTEIKLFEQNFIKLNENLERKISERTEEYKQSETKFRELLKFVPDGIVLVNEKGKISLVNDQTEKIFGFSKDELIDSDLSRLIPGSLTQRHDAHFKHFLSHPLERQMGAGLDINGQRKNGEIFPVDIRLGVVYLDNKLHIIGIVRDVTQRKKDEAELRKLSQSLEQHPSAVIITNKEGEIEYVNPKFLNTTGYRLEEVVGENPRFLKALDLPKQFYKELWNTILDKRVWYGDMPNKTKGGELFWTRSSIAPIINEKGEITNFVSVQYDITEIKKNEELLKFTSYSFDNAADAAYWLESETGTFVHVNKEGCKRLGYTKEEFIGLNVSDVDMQLSTPEKWSKFSKELLFKVSMTFESEFIKKNGNIFPGEIIASTIEYEGKNFFIAFVRDITSKRKVNEELRMAKALAESANRTKSEFLANMSHEIRTPMNAVLGITDLLSQQIEDKVQLSYLDTIKTSGRGLLAIINDILDISKIEAGKLEIKYGYFDLMHSLEELNALFQLKAKDKGIRLETNFSDSVPHSVYLDELRLKQVLTNLLSNSIKFTASGFVKVTVDLLGGLDEKSKTVDLIVQVEDSGVGIEEEFKDRVFDAFSQQDGQDSKKYGGSGLGLPISRKLIELMGGTISVDSKKNIGSLFTVNLYRVKYSQNYERVKEPAEDRVSKRNFLPCKVIVADDVEANRRYLIGALGGTSIEVLVAKNGLEAYNLACEHHPELILTDIIMPVMDGFELSAKIKSNPELGNIVIIANSAAVLSFSPEKIEQGKFDEFIPKPIKLSELYQVLRNYLPYSTQKLNTPVKVGSSKRDIKIPNEVKKELLDKTETMWLQLQKQQKIKQVEDFSRIIRSIGDEYSQSILINYCNKLDDAVKAFDIGGILRLLNRYRFFVK